MTCKIISPSGHNLLINCQYQFHNQPSCDPWQQRSANQQTCSKFKCCRSARGNILRQSICNRATATIVSIQTVKGGATSPLASPPGAFPLPIFQFYLLTSIPTPCADICPSGCLLREVSLSAATTRGHRLPHVSKPRLRLGLRSTTKLRKPFWSNLATAAMCGVSSVMSGEVQMERILNLTPKLIGRHNRNQ